MTGIVIHSSSQTIWPPTRPSLNFPPYAMRVGELCRTAAATRHAYRKPTLGMNDIMNSQTSLCPSQRPSGCSEHQPELKKYDMGIDKGTLGNETLDATAEAESRKGHCSRANVWMKNPTFRRVAASVLAGVGLVVSQGAFAVEIEHLNSGLILPTNLPFSEAVRVGDTIYLSGQIGNRPGTLDLVPGGIAAETKQVMENIKATLEAHKLTFDNVVKCTVILENMADWAAFNEVYATFFKKGRYPTRTAFGSSGLALGAKAEVECIAVE
jgi:2-iminobutanoate/2-iminopropanoate deaminase